MHEIDKASDMDTVIIKELDENGNVLKMTSYLNGEQNYLYTQVFNDHGDLIERDDEDGNLVSMKSTYNGDDGYFIDYIYAALNDASYNGEGTLLFDAATDTPSAA